MNQHLKVTSLVIAGNILEYYDFLLFMHLGPLITPLFFPGYSSKETHFLSLLLFGLAFITRPIGGYVFGRLSDLKGRKVALVKSVKWALLPAFGLTLLPTYETIGVLATCIFVFLRLFQGIALGGEYPNAGTYLVEYYKDRLGFISGILGASGTIGSVIGFTLAYFCSQPEAPAWLWRFSFFLGGVGGILSYFLRRHLVEISPSKPSPNKSSFESYRLKWTLVTMIGTLVGTSLWLPMTYSNFYLTKILGFPTEQGQVATLISLVGYIFFCPLWGAFSDRVNHFSFMMWMALAIIPTSLFSFFLLSQGNFILAQSCLIFMASAFGAPIHAVMNSLFPVHLRGRSVALLFMVGLSLGGITPSVASYIVDKTGFQFTPAIIVSMIALITASLFYTLGKKRSIAFAR